MAWRDRLRPASFRGIPFFIDTSQFTTGRRVQLHEFPDRDNPFPEDLGKNTRTFRVEGHILGDYWATKDSLIEACEQEGPGELIHPYYGTRQVQVGPVSFDEDTLEGQFLKVTFLFYEAGDNRFPRAVDDKQVLLENSADASLAAVKDDFDNNFTILGFAGFVVDTAREAVNAAADAIEQATEGLVQTIEEIADLAFSIRNLKAEVNDLLQSPQLLSQRLLDSLELLEGALGTPEGQLRANSTLFTFVGNADADFVRTTPSRIRQADNEEIFNNFIRRAAIIKGVVQASEVDYDSVQSATAQREELVDLLEEQSLNTTDDTVFQSLGNLNAQLVEVLPDVDAELPNIKTVQLTATNHSLALAYDLFENPEAEQDIIDRNGIRHPGFILGDTELEVVDVRASS
jgi:prophage DNA circulation protein